ncbi:MAG: RCC1 domain-containing protein [Janthinobacterium lividum]
MHVFSLPSLVVAGLLLLTLALAACHPDQPARADQPTGPALRSWATGARHVVRVAADGSLWAAGYNDGGIAGAPDSVYGLPKWGQVGTATNWAQVAAGRSHSLALTTEGRAYAWGTNRTGELGPGLPVDDAPHPAPVPVPGHYAQVVAGNGYSLALDAEGQLWAWGSNFSGVLGPGVSVEQPHPAPLRLPGRWKSVAAGWYHVLALRPDGTLYAWGSNLRGQLGPGVPVSNVDHPAPVQVPGHYAQVAAGEAFSLALTAEGQLWAWGDNFNGQLATPTNSWRATHNQTPPPLPTPRLLPGRWTQVAAGTAFVLALRADGQLWAWGSNGQGELSRSPNEDSATPAPVPGRYTRVAAGGQHCLGLGTDGILYAWGSNDVGQLGNNTPGDYFNDAPHPVPTPTP